MVWIVVLLAISVIAVSCSSSAVGNQNSNENPGQQSTQSTESTESNSGGGSTALEEKEMEKNISIGTHPQGTNYNTMGTAFASVISKYSPVKVTARPFSGPNAWMPLLNDTNEVQLGAISAPDANWAFTGKVTYKEPNKNLRLLVRGQYIHGIGLTVKKDSGIQTVSDLKGKRVASEYSGNQIFKLYADAQLAMAGLSWDDVRPVPVSDLNSGIEALREGRVDAAIGGAPESAVTVEAHNAVGGLVALDMAEAKPDQNGKFSQELVDEFQSYVPGADFVISQSGFLSRETVIVQYPGLIVTNAQLSDDAAYEIVKSIWENYEELQPILPLLKDYNTEQIFDPNPAVPYHPGAMKFYKEQGVWNDSSEKRQQELLELAK